MGEAQGKCGWGVAGLGWVAGDFIVPAMVQQKARLAACVGSTLGPLVAAPGPHAATNRIAMTPSVTVSKRPMGLLL